MTSPYGRKATDEGPPIKVAELLSALGGPVYIERTAVYNPQNVIKTKKAIKKAFENQINNKGFSLVEVLSPCPVNWRLSVKDSLKFIEDEMIKVFPLGVFKDR